MLLQMLLASTATRIQLSINSTAGAQRTQQAGLLHANVNACVIVHSLVSQ